MLRENNRAKDRMRKLKITPSFMKFAEGSCLIELGNTKVICTASIEEKVPLFLKNTGSGWVTAEYGMLPRSCKTRITRESSIGKVGGRTHEIQRLIGRTLRAVVDLKAIGERTVWIDCDVIQGDGGTRTASISGSFIALAMALDKLKADAIIKNIPINDYVAATSVGIIKGEAMLDLSYEEDYCAEVDMNIIMTSDKFIEIQGTAEHAPFSQEQMDKLVTLAKSGIKEIISLQKKTLEELNILL